MTTLGIIGGIGPESTIEYYRLLIAGYRRMRPDGSYPSIVINSISVTKLLAWLGATSLPRCCRCRLCGGGRPPAHAPRRNISFDLHQQHLGDEVARLDGCNFVTEMLLMTIE